MKCPNRHDHNNEFCLSTANTLNIDGVVNDLFEICNNEAEGLSLQDFGKEECLAFVDKAFGIDNEAVLTKTFHLVDDDSNNILSKEEIKTALIDSLGNDDES